MFIQILLYRYKCLFGFQSYILGISSLLYTSFPSPKVFCADILMFQSALSSSIFFEIFQNLSVRKQIMNNSPLEEDWQCNFLYVGATTTQYRDFKLVFIVS